MKDSYELWQSNVMLDDSALQLASKVIENAKEGIVITDNVGKVLAINSGFSYITGFTSEELIGKNWFRLKSDQVGDVFYRLLGKYLEENDKWTGELWYRCKNGEEYKAQVNISVFKGPGNEIKNYVVAFPEISDLKRTEQQLSYFTQYDSLTGLPNRFLFNERLNKILAKAKDKNQMVAILFLDLDRFKRINDTLGYSVGDLILQSVAQRITNCFNNRDNIARLGGDEFLIVIENINTNQDIVKMAENILDFLSKPYIVKGQEFFINISMGISLFPAGGSDAEILIKNAETAMDNVKQQGRNNYSIYTPTMNTTANDRLSLENNLRKALQREEFILCYQPQIEIESGKLIGMEALVRWNHPKQGLINPVDFIPLAEESGLIVPIGEQVLYMACRQNKVWQEAGFSPVRVAVNLSARQFQQHTLIQDVSHVLKETGLDPNYLELEITESIMMQNADLTVEILKELRGMGISVALDDFGTGYSSLNYIRQFPINRLKIDKSFISDIACQTKDNAILNAVINMAHSLNLKVIAEGVETKQQLEFLRGCRCYGAQGFLFSRPLVSRQLNSILTRGSFLEC